jgi:hypothetical protein
MEVQTKKLFKHTQRDITKEYLFFKDDETLPEIVDRLGPDGEGWDFTSTSVNEVTVGGRRAIEIK